MTDREFEDALRSYGAAAPRAGLESRVLARVRHKGRWMPRWVWAVPVLAGLASFGFFVSINRPVAVISFSVRAPAPPARERTPPPLPVKRTLARAPKRPVFPTPSSLTEEEQAMAAFFRAASPAQLVAFAAPMKEIKIPLLESPENR